MEGSDSSLHHNLTQLPGPPDCVIPGSPECVAAYTIVTILMSSSSLAAHRFSVMPCPTGSPWCPVPQVPRGALSHRFPGRGGTSAGSGQVLHLHL